MSRINSMTSIKNYFSKRDSTVFKKPYIIAEAGVNHEGSMDIAKRLIDEAKEGGADAIKFQTYKAETIASKESPAYWDTSKEPTTSQYKLFKKHDKFWKEEFINLKKYCDEIEIEFLSTPFDTEAADFLNELMPVFKISSSDITNKPFIQYLCNFGKPIILSTGASYLYEIEEAVHWIEAENVPFALLHCVLNYPTDDENANLGMISGLKRKFPETVVGYSDHTLPKDMQTLVTAALLGAEIIEKHFTHDKSLPGNDHYHAMDMNDLKVYNRRMDKIFRLLGESHVGSLKSEEISRQNARRSLVAKKSIPAGKTIEYDDLTWKRPASGISPRHIDDVIGKISIESIDEDEILQWWKLSDQRTK
jgi:sialic acid synthase SpsE